MKKFSTKNIFRSTNLKSVSGKQPPKPQNNRISQSTAVRNSLQEILHPLPKLLYYFTFQPTLTH